MSTSEVYISFLSVSVQKNYLLIVLAFLFGCQETSPPPPVIQLQPTHGKEGKSVDRIIAKVPSAPMEDFVGSSACIECHAEICETYRGTTMARSAALACDANVVEKYDENWVVMSRMFRANASKTDQAIRHTEQLLSTESDVLCEYSEPIYCEIGSGRRGRSYLIERDDQLMLSPLTWYSTANQWDLSPGYAKNNLHFERRIVEECIHCHVGRMTPSNSLVDDRFAKPAFIEAGISCERCHGPAGRHVTHYKELANGAPGLTTEKDSIVNPGKLAPELRESVCNECHQLGVEKILRFGMHVQDFRPGNPLSSVWVVFNKGDGSVGADGSTEAVNQVQQMESSVCYQKSDGRFGCTSCHNPHFQPSESNRLQFFRNKCNDCHSAETKECSCDRSERLKTSSEDSCIACHMPSLPSSDVQHTSQTDHRVLRKPAYPPPTEVQEVLELAASMKAVPEWEVERARGLLMARFAVDLSDPALATITGEMLEKLTERGLDDPIVERSLGDVYLLQNRLEVAEQRWKNALTMDPQNEQALRSMAIAFHDAGRDAEAEALLRAYLKENRWDRTMIGRHIHVLGRLGRSEEALSEAELAVVKFPYDRLIRQWLVNAYAAVGRSDDSQKHKVIADRLTPQK